MDVRFYKFKRHIGVADVLVEDTFGSIKDDLGRFKVEDPSLPQDSWQVLYMEQYFGADRLDKLCETYDEPPDDAKSFRLVFFLYDLQEGQTLQTPWGSVPVTKLEKLPPEYKKNLEFEKED